MPSRTDSARRVSPKVPGKLDFGPPQSDITRREYEFRWYPGDTQFRKLRVVGEPAKPPARRRNSEVRSREYLTPTEVETLRKTARERGRCGHRDATMILVAYRHGLRVSELVDSSPSAAGR
jgi:integrase